MKISPAKTRIGFIDMITFAAVDKINNGKVCAHVLLRKKSASKKFVKIEGPIHGWYVHHFCFADRSFFNEEMLSCLRASCGLRTAS